MFALKKNTIFMAQIVQLSPTARAQFLAFIQHILIAQSEGHEIAERYAEQELTQLREMRYIGGNAMYYRQSEEKMVKKKQEQPERGRSANKTMR